MVRVEWLRFGITQPLALLTGRLVTASRIPAIHHSAFTIRRNAAPASWSV